MPPGGEGAAGSEGGAGGAGNAGLQLLPGPLLLGLMFAVARLLPSTAYL